MIRRTIQKIPDINDLPETKEYTLCDHSTLAIQIRKGVFGYAHGDIVTLHSVNEVDGMPSKDQVFIGLQEWGSRHEVYAWFGDIDRDDNVGFIFKDVILHRTTLKTPGKYHGYVIQEKIDV